MAALKILITGITKKQTAPALIFLFILSCVSIEAYSSPHPAVGSSALVAPEKGLFFQRYGFLLKTAQSNWAIATPSEQITFVNPSSESGSLSVRMETLRTDMTLENYAKRWMKDYSNYGFDVLGTKAFGLNKTRGLVVDLDHKKSGQQLRQILFLKEKKVVILTCKDQISKFESTLQGCNQIAKSFEWSEIIRQKAF